MPKVADAIRLVEREGWVLARTTGRHRVYEHPHKPCIVAIAGWPSKNLPIGTWLSIRRQAGLK